jgi:hypothetical protein
VYLLREALSEFERHARARLHSRPPARLVLGMRKLPQTAAEDLLEIIMRRYERQTIGATSGWQAAQSIRGGVVAYGNWLTTAT